MTWPCALIGHKIILATSPEDQVAICLRCGMVRGVFDERWARRVVDIEPSKPGPKEELAPDPERPTKGPPRAAWPEAKARPPV